MWALGVEEKHASHSFMRATGLWTLGTHRQPAFVTVDMIGPRPHKHPDPRPLALKRFIVGVKMGHEQHRPLGPEGCMVLLVPAHQAAAVGRDRTSFTHCMTLSK